MPAVDRGVMDHEAAPLRPTSHSHRACQPLWLAAVTIFITDSRMFTLPATWPSPALWLAGGRSSRDSLPAHRDVLLYFRRSRSLFRPLGSPGDTGGSISERVEQLHEATSCRNNGSAFSGRRRSATAAASPLILVILPWSLGLKCQQIRCNG